MEVKRQGKREHVPGGDQEEARQVIACTSRGQSQDSVKQAHIFVCAGPGHAAARHQPCVRRLPRACAQDSCGCSAAAQQGCAARGCQPAPGAPSRNELKIRDLGFLPDVKFFLAPFLHAHVSVLVVCRGNRTRARTPAVVRFAHEFRSSSTALLNWLEAMLSVWGLHSSSALNPPCYAAGWWPRCWQGLWGDSITLSGAIS